MFARSVLIVGLWLGIWQIPTESGIPTDPSAPVHLTSVKVPARRGRFQGISQFETGVTHTHYSLDPWGDAPSIARAKKLLGVACRYQNQHLMGWGADNPNPAPGVYRWDSLDRRIRLIRSMKAEPVITLCAAPDWMKGGPPGETDWSKIEVAPLPAHFADFAALAKKVAQRYPDVLHFQVWNEMKGFWDPKINNWDYKGYTALYNLVYDALKSVNPKIQVGGPYLVIEGTGSERGGWAAEKPIRARQWEALEYWLTHKHGAEFITLDRGLVDFHDPNRYTEEELMQMTSSFGEVAHQIHEKTDLPIWWAEFYGSSSKDRDFIAAQYASIMRGMVLSGASVALLWEPQDAGGDLTESLFTDTRKPGGGQPYPIYAVFKAFHDYFSKGAYLFDAGTIAGGVETLGSSKKLMLINTRPETMTIRFQSPHSGKGKASFQTVTLNRYQVRVIDRPQ